MQKGDSTKGHYYSGMITKNFLNKHVPEIETRRIHICGPEPMMDAVKQMLNELKVPKANVKIESFDTPSPALKTSNPSKVEDEPVKEADKPASIKTAAPSTAQIETQPPQEEKENENKTDEIETQSPSKDENKTDLEKKKVTQKLVAGPL